MAFPLAAAIGALGSIGGAIFSGRSAQRAAADNRDFQERMSNTSHQREVRDLRKAGLNPILSATGGAGASTPGGAVAQVPDYGEAVTKSAMFAAELAKTKADTALATSAKELNDQMGSESASRTLNNQLDYNLKNQWTGPEKSVGIASQNQAIAESLQRVKEIDARTESTGLDAKRKAADLKAILADPVLQRYVLSQEAGIQAQYDKILQNPDGGDALRFLMQLLRR